MDKVSLNNSPDLKITNNELFNNEFMSDIQFHIGGKVMYAHSWVLMNRSTVFMQKFRRNNCENEPISMIPIDDVSYKAFLNFLKYIYTDQIEEDETEDLLCDMFKLAVRYKIFKLETRLLNTSYESFDTDLKLFEFGVLNKYELCINHFLERILYKITPDKTNEVTFLNIHESVLAKILESDMGFNRLKERDAFDALVLWMDNSCTKNQIPLERRRSHFDKLIRLIRYSAMTSNDLKSLEKLPDLFTDNDKKLIWQSWSCRSVEVNSIWNNKPRSKYKPLWASNKISDPDKREYHLTKFTVLDDLILKGLRYTTLNTNYYIQISSTNLESNVTDTIQFKREFEFKITNMSFGDSIRLAPNYEYSIEINVERPIPKGGFLAYYRDPEIKAIITGPIELVNVMTTGENLLEIIFQSPSE